ncbi:hypothetical protein AB6A40_007577 [Gnathostoma spinigerum]|uniref:Uncharacterized protein n=1 Tax=Gnathostoma spinigerum TaxID=75299 RepID=A0ABD6ELW4_9BILA
MTTNSLCCLFANHVRHLILLLGVACSAILFSNLIIFNYTVIYSHRYHLNQNFLVESDKSNIQRDAIKRIPRSIVNPGSKDVTTSETKVIKSLHELPQSTMKGVATSSTLNSTVNVSKDSKGLFSDESRNNTIHETPSMTAKSAVQTHANSTELATTESSTASSTSASNTKLTPSLTTPYNVDSTEAKSNREKDDESHTSKPGSDLQRMQSNGMPTEYLTGNKWYASVWLAPAIGILLGVYPSIWMLQTLGARKLFTIALLLSAFATGSLGVALPHDIGTFTVFCCRLVHGLTFSAVFPTIGSITSNWGTLKTQACFLFWSVSFVQVAPLISWLTSVWLARIEEHMIYVAHLLITCSAAAVWLLFYRDRPQYHPWVNGLELNMIVTGKIKAITNRSLETHPCKTLIRTISCWAIWVAAFGYFLVIALYSQFLPIFFFTYVGHSQHQSGLDACFPFFVMIVFSFLGTFWTKVSSLCRPRIAVRLFVVISYVLCAGCLLFLSILSSGEDYSYCAMFGFSFGLAVLGLSHFGVYQSANVVGRYFTQYIVANIQVSVGVAFFFSASLVTFIVTDK